MAASAFIKLSFVEPVGSTGTFLHQLTNSSRENFRIFIGISNNCLRNRILLCHLFNKCCGNKSIAHVSALSNCLVLLIFQTALANIQYCQYRLFLQ